MWWHLWVLLHVPLFKKLAKYIIYYNSSISTSLIWNRFIDFISIVQNFLNPIIELNVENIMIMMDLPIVIIFTCFNLAGTSNWYNHWMYNRHGPTVVLIRIQPWTCLKFVKRSVGLIKEERHISDLDSKKKAWKWIYMHAELIIKPGAEI